MIGEFIVTDVELINKGDDGINAYNVRLKGVEQQLFMRAKNPPQVGMPEQGEIKKETGRSGKPYYRFYREQRQTSNPVLEKLDAIHADIKKLLGDEPLDTSEAEKLDEVHPVPDEPISLKDIPF